jgi:hypothetical protein
MRSWGIKPKTNKEYLVPHTKKVKNGPTGMNFRTTSQHSKNIKDNV